MAESSALQPYLDWSKRQILGSSLPLRRLYKFLTPTGDALQTLPPPRTIVHNAYPRRAGDFLRKLAALD